MQYRQLVKRVADYSGFSNQESEIALRLFTETLAARLTNGERKDFASQLPQELQSIAVDIPEDPIPVSMEDIYDTFSELQAIDRTRAQKQIMAAWHALKDALNAKEIDHIRAQLPNDIVTELR